MHKNIIEQKKAQIIIVRCLIRSLFLMAMPPKIKKIPADALSDALMEGNSGGCMF
jgi:hypothetical protein